MVSTMLLPGQNQSLYVNARAEEFSLIKSEMLSVISSCVSWFYADFGGRVSSNSLLVDHEQQLTGRSSHCWAQRRQEEEEPETVRCFHCFLSLFLGIIVAELFPACREG